MAITEKDKHIVRKTAEEAFGHHALKSGVYPADEELNKILLEVADELPAHLTLNRLNEIFAAGDFKASAAYLKKFFGEFCFEKLRRMQTAAKFKTEFETPRFCDIARRLENKFSGGAGEPEIAPPTAMNIQ